MTSSPKKPETGADEKPEDTAPSARVVEPELKNEPIEEVYIDFPAEPDPFPTAEPMKQEVTLAAVEQPVTDLPGELPDDVPSNAVPGAFIGIDPGSKGMPSSVREMPLRPTEE